MRISKKSPPKKRPTYFLKDAFIDKKVVIAICTHNRRELLLAALKAVSKLETEAYYDVSVLIIENEKEPKLGAELSALDFPFDIHHVHEPALGLVSGRNRSLDEAEKMGADWLGLLDDDDQVHEHWLLRLEQAASELPDCLAFFGQDKEKLPPDYSEYLGAVRPRDKKLGTAPTILKTGNCMIGRAIFASDHYGFRFDPRFNFSGGEDTDFFMRIRNEGLRLCSVPEAILYDLKHGERRTYKYHFRRTQWEHTNLYFLYRINMGAGIARRMLVKDLKRNLRFFLVDIIKGAFVVLSNRTEMRIKFGSAGLRIAKIMAIYDYCVGNRPSPYNVAAKEETQTPNKGQS
ncbi:GT2 family glycosyltransferase [Yoonia maricola]|uniref:GT2 family glycosyltransferase n=1 Tax=Yoonia maricola TaxID=420999 RepID=A0A2M8WM95_9RHOB|nr:glycosyltransferase [Yoonia maricola]PJI92048.1 GT2 family glycosyltransferase [Yoonia maricola]